MRVWLYGASLGLSLVVACGGAAQPTATPADLPPMAPVRATTEDQRPSPDMSTRLGGLALGMTVDAFSDTCQAKGAKAIPDERAQTILCTVPPEPLSIEGTSVSFDGVLLGVFCGPTTTVCELAYVVYGKSSERAEQVRALLGMLTRRYGPPAATEGSSDTDPAHACAAATSTVHSVRSWSFGPPRALGKIRVVFDCEPREGGPQVELRVVYDDAKGIARATSP
jgi:hypothetical protein